jgi:hypothetical protein
VLALASCCSILLDSSTLRFGKFHIVQAKIYSLFVSYLLFSFTSFIFFCWLVQSLANSTLAFMSSLREGRSSSFSLSLELLLPHATRHTCEELDDDLPLRLLCWASSSR